MSGTETVKSWYDHSYHQAGLGAQRRYPNEELLRFLGRHYFSMPLSQRAATRILEIGCGSGANLWMMAREGFDVHGIDLSSEAIDLCRQMLKSWDTAATLHAASMTSCPCPDGSFDAIVDVFSSYCLAEPDFSACLDEVARMLRPGGRFFSYSPSKASNAFRNPSPSRHIDASTLDGIHRDTSPFYGNFYPFRFIDSAEYRDALESRGLKVTYNEVVGRSYRDRAEYFEFVVVVAERC